MIFLEGAGEGLSYTAEGAQSGLRFAFHNLPNLALWQKPGAPFLCIEPWHGTAAEAGSAGEIEKRPYATVLAPAKTASFAFSVELPA
jgi:galactose mutarotase-like enzyme